MFTRDDISLAYCCGFLAFASDANRENYAFGRGLDLPNLYQLRNAKPKRAE